MKWLKRAICSLCIVLCSACATTSKPIKYYSLILDGESNRPGLIPPLASARATTIKNIIIAPIHLTKFLLQDGIVTQIGRNEITVANYHRWAEPLNESIAIVLQKDLNSKARHYHFIRLINNRNAHAKFILRIEMDQFYIRKSGEVVTGGHYWLFNKTTSLLHDQAFTITQPLTANGYSSAVEKLKQSLQLLADKILAGLKGSTGEE